VLKAGTYVRVLNPMKTIHGTIAGCSIKNGVTVYQIQTDPQACSEAVADSAYASEGELELCERPSNEKGAAK
jgi:hypothetical protein